MDFEMLKQDIIRDEGIQLKPYRDTMGLLTIGIGRNLEQGITEAEAFFLFGEDVRGVIGDLDNNIPWWRLLSDTAQRGLVNMAFNLGWPRLANFRKMLEALRNQNYDSASKEALDSKWASQVGARAQRIAELFRST